MRGAAGTDSSRIYSECRGELRRAQLWDHINAWIWNVPANIKEERERGGRTMVVSLRPEEKREKKIVCNSFYKQNLGLAHGNYTCSVGKVQFLYPTFYPTSLKGWRVFTVKHTRQTVSSLKNNVKCERELLFWNVCQGLEKSWWWTAECPVWMSLMKC